MDVMAFEIAPEQIHVIAVSDLWASAEHIEEIDLPLTCAVHCINGFLNSFDSNDWLRVMNADLSYPIIISDATGVMDGCHRVMKALICGQTTIKAKRISTFPQPVEIFNSWKAYARAEF